MARRSASRVGASSLSIVLAATLVLAASTGFVVLVAAVVLVVQGLLASAPSPADARGRSIPTPRSVATFARILARRVAITTLRPPA